MKSKNSTFAKTAVQKTEKVDWAEYIRNDINYRIASPAMTGLFAGFKRHFGRGMKRFMAYFEKQNCYWYYDRNELYQLGKHIINKLTKPEDSKRLLNAFDLKTEEILNFLNKFEPKNAYGKDNTE